MPKLRSKDGGCGMNLNKELVPMLLDEVRKYMDVVEVVRCRNCTWFDPQRVCLRHGRFVENSNWYCADGERGERCEK